MVNVVLVKFHSNSDIAEHEQVKAQNNKLIFAMKQKKQEKQEKQCDFEMPIEWHVKVDDSSCAVISIGTKKCILELIPQINNNLLHFRKTETVLEIDYQSNTRSKKGHIRRHTGGFGSSCGGGGNGGGN